MQELTVDQHQRQEAAGSTTDPFGTILEIAGGYCLPRCLHVVANLGVADMLDETPRTAADLAADVGADPEALSRVLRLLAAHDVFEVEGDTFRHSPASQLLRTDHPRSMRSFAQMFGLPINWSILGALEHSVRTGSPAIAEVYPEGFWAYLGQHPEEGRVFNAAMVAKAHGHVAAIMASYDFSRFRTIGDIGGGSGHLLMSVLDSVPAARGVLFDLPHVVAEAGGIASERLTLQAGDFFRDNLPACDGYLLMEVIHDWADSESVAILQAIRRTALPNATLLLIEAIIPDHPGPAWTKMLDIHMLALLGGKQRTRLEYEALLNQAGFTLQREIDTHAGISILEAVTV